MLVSDRDDFLRDDDHQLRRIKVCKAPGEVVLLGSGLEVERRPGMQEPSQIGRAHV